MINNLKFTIESFYSRILNNNNNEETLRIQTSNYKSEKINLALITYYLNKYNTNENNEREIKIPAVAIETHKNTKRSLEFILNQPKNNNRYIIKEPSIDYPFTLLNTEGQINNLNFLRFFEDYDNPFESQFFLRIKNKSRVTKKTNNARIELPLRKSSKNYRNYIIIPIIDENSIEEIEKSYFHLWHRNINRDLKITSSKNPTTNNIDIKKIKNNIKRVIKTISETKFTNSSNQYIEILSYLFKDPEDSKKSKNPLFRIKKQKKTESITDITDDKTTYDNQKTINKTLSEIKSLLKKELNHIKNRTVIKDNIYLKKEQKIKKLREQIESYTIAVQLPEIKNKYFLLNQLKNGLPIFETEYLPISTQLFHKIIKESNSPFIDYLNISLKKANILYNTKMDSEINNKAISLNFKKNMESLKNITSIREKYRNYKTLPFQIIREINEKEEKFLKENSTVVISIEIKRDTYDPKRDENNHYRICDIIDKIKMDSIKY